MVFPDPLFLNYIPKSIGKSQISRLSQPFASIFSPPFSECSNLTFLIHPSKHPTYRMIVKYINIALPLEYTTIFVV
jgi:hypothetical protein